MCTVTSDIFTVAGKPCIAAIKTIIAAGGPFHISYSQFTAAHCLCVASKKAITIVCERVHRCLRLFHDCR